MQNHVRNHSFAFLFLEALNTTQRVIHDYMLLECTVDAGTQLVKIAHLRVAGQRGVLLPFPCVVCPCDCFFVQIVLEALHPFGGYPCECDALILLVYAQVVQAGEPIAVVASCIIYLLSLLTHCDVIVEEIHIARIERVSETMLTVLQFHDSLRLD